MIDSYYDNYIKLVAIKARREANGYWIGAECRAFNNAKKDKDGNLIARLMTKTTKNPYSSHYIAIYDGKSSPYTKWVDDSEIMETDETSDVPAEQIEESPEPDPILDNFQVDTSNLIL